MAVEMVTVNGVRYRPEHAPKVVEEKAVKPANKSVDPKNKAVSDVDSKSDAVESGGSRSGKARRG